MTGQLKENFSGALLKWNGRTDSLGFTSFGFEESRRHPPGSHWIGNEFSSVWN